jgi:hypothetical protein
MPVWMICCPVCGGCVGNGLQRGAPGVAAAAVGTRALAPCRCLSWHPCAAVPFYLAFALFWALRQLWLSRDRSGISR